MDIYFLNDNDEHILFSNYIIRINNCIANMEVGCLRHQGASTTGNQLLDEDCSHGWQVQPTHPWTPMQCEEQVTLLKQRKEGGVGGKLPGQWAATIQKCQKITTVEFNYWPKGFLIGVNKLVKLELITFCKLLFTSIKGTLQVYVNSARWIKQSVCIIWF